MVVVLWEGCGVGERLESRWEDGWDVTSEMMSVQKTMVDVRWKKTWNRCRFRARRIRPLGSDLRSARPTGQPTPTENNFWSVSLWGPYLTPEIRGQAMMDTASLQRPAWLGTQPRVDTREKGRGHRALSHCP